MTKAGSRKKKSVQVFKARPVESQQPAKKCMRGVFKKNKKQPPVGGELLPANSLMAICHNVTGETLWQAHFHLHHLLKFSIHHHFLQSCRPVHIRTSLRWSRLLGWWWIYEDDSNIEHKHFAHLHSRFEFRAALGLTYLVWAEQSGISTSELASSTSILEWVGLLSWSPPGTPVLVSMFGLAPSPLFPGPNPPSGSLCTVPGGLCRRGFNLRTGNFWHCPFSRKRWPTAWESLWQQSLWHYSQQAAAEYFLSVSSTCVSVFGHVRLDSWHLVGGQAHRMWGPSCRVKVGKGPLGAGATKSATQDLLAARSPVGNVRKLWLQIPPTWAMMPHTPSTPRNLISRAESWLAFAPFRRTILATGSCTSVYAMATGSNDVTGGCRIIEPTYTFASVHWTLDIFWWTDWIWLHECVIYFKLKLSTQGHNGSHLCSLFPPWSDRTKDSWLVLCCQIFVQALCSSPFSFTVLYQGSIDEHVHPVSYLVPIKVKAKEVPVKVNTTKIYIYLVSFHQKLSWFCVAYASVDIDCISSPHN